MICFLTFAWGVFIGGEAWRRICIFFFWVGWIGVLLTFLVNKLAGVPAYEEPSDEA